MADPSNDAMDTAIVDTDILNELLKQKNALVVQNATTYLIQHRQFTISSITRYEILRGLKELGAAVQLARFDAFCQQAVVLPISDGVLDRASDLWAAARNHGHSAQDADLVIAATAIEHDLVLITGNVAHFAWIAGLRLENWRE